MVGLRFDSPGKKLPPHPSTTPQPPAGGAAPNSKPPPGGATAGTDAAGASDGGFLPFGGGDSDLGEAAAPRKPPRIFYATRTHSQARWGVQRGGVVLVWRQWWGAVGRSGHGDGPCGWNRWCRVTRWGRRGAT